MAKRWCGVILAVALACGGCGGSDKETEPGLTASQARSLTARLDQARQAGTARDLPQTLARLRAFRARVASLRRAGALDASTARRLRLGAVRAEARANTELAAPPAVTQPAPAPKEEEKKQEEDKPGKKRQKKHGKGKA